MEEFSAIQSGGTADRLLVVSGRMTVHYIGEIKAALIEAFKGTEQLTCDLEQVSEMDLTGLQLLCSAHRESLAKGIPFFVRGLDTESIHPVLVEAGFPRNAGCLQDTNKTCLWVGGEQ